MLGSAALAQSERRSTRGAGTDPRLCTAGSCTWLGAASTHIHHVSMCRHLPAARHIRHHEPADPLAAQVRTCRCHTRCVVHACPCSMARPLTWMSAVGLYLFACYQCLNVVYQSVHAFPPSPHGEWNARKHRAVASWRGHHASQSSKGFVKPMGQGFPALLSSAMCGMMLCKSYSGLCPNVLLCKLVVHVLQILSKAQHALLQDQDGQFHSLKLLHYKKRKH